MIDAKKRPQHDLWRCNGQLINYEIAAEENKGELLQQQVFQKSLQLLRSIRIAGSIESA